MEVQLAVFWLLAAIGLGSAVLMVTRRNPVHAALYLVVTFFAVASIYVVLHAEFLAAVQVLVYAGGIMVLFLFVIFLVDQPREGAARATARSAHVAAAIVLTALLVLILAFHASRAGIPSMGSPDALAADGGNIETLALHLFRYYLLPFEVVSILLLAAMVGAIVLARPKA